MALSWQAYAKRRTGVAVGGKGALAANLQRAFQASSLQRFWQIWNPLFGFYLQRFIYRPLRRWLARPLALWGTFVGNGMLHDAVSIGLSGQWRCFFVPWFAVIGALVVLESWRGRSFIPQTLFWRPWIHLLILGGSAWLAWQLGPHPSV